ncbi:hypothetical protein FRC08_004877 [Ceratobasidium sp. 394]|nr:hypothetical protein FRC08_004877 [Ceratobasidium sp. 394]KAG9102175.1 hypothetical protein FS749_013378 [Ceratobasidium sp. UAMH 11750]
MFSLTRLVALAAAVAVSVSTSPLSVRQPVYDATPVDYNSPAVAMFGTITDPLNWTTHPTDLCIVPGYANEAGLSEQKTPLTVGQAVDLCPHASRIKVHVD